MPLFRRALRVFCAGVGLAGLASCSSGKVDQCNQLIEVANQAVTELGALTDDSAPRDTDTFTAISEAAQQATSQLEAVDLTDEQLQSYRQRFIKLYSEIGEATDQLVKAVEGQNLPTAEDAYDDLESTINQEQPLVDEVNQYCQPS